ncbi:hypothetical protein ACC761_29085 [Rhizobium ruizarguesonis]
MTLATSTVSLIILGAISVSTIVRTDAHEAKSGWTYPPACCKAPGFLGDCQAIPTQDISRGPRGFSVFLHAGDHHLATKSHLFFIPYGDEIASGDGRYHICLHPTEDDVNCFFSPPATSQSRGNEVDLSFDVIGQVGFGDASKGDLQPINDSLEYGTINDHPVSLGTASLRVDVAATKKEATTDWLRSRSPIELRQSSKVPTIMNRYPGPSD